MDFILDVKKRDRDARPESVAPDFHRQRIPFGDFLVPLRDPAGESLPCSR